MFYHLEAEYRSTAVIGAVFLLCVIFVITPLYVFVDATTFWLVIVIVAGVCALGPLAWKGNWAMTFTILAVALLISACFSSQGPSPMQAMIPLEPLSFADG
jgi:hypothetical protein